MNKLNFNFVLSKQFGFKELITFTKKILNEYTFSESLLENSINNQLCQIKLSSFNDILKEMNEEEFHLLTLSNEIIVLNFQQSRNKFRIFGNTTKIAVVEFIKEILKQNVLYYFCHHDEDLKLSRVNKVNVWKRKLKGIPNSIRLIENPRSVGGERDKFLIELESVPTHQHQMKTDEKLWFGACWQMYFSEIYYKYIPKNLWDSHLNCFENIILENGVRKITLYKNPYDYNLDKNRAMQWEFRRLLGIDSIAHELCLGNRSEPANLPVKITKKNCKKGETRVIRYIDSIGNLVSMDKAMKMEIKEYLNDGITIVLEKSENI